MKLGFALRIALAVGLAAIAGLLFVDGLGSMLGDPPIGADGMRHKAAAPILAVFAGGGLSAWLAIGLCVSLLPRSDGRLMVRIGLISTAAALAAMAAGILLGSVIPLLNSLALAALAAFLAGPPIAAVGALRQALSRARSDASART